MSAGRAGVSIAVAVVVAAALAGPARATVEMQVQAKKLGFAVHNCLYCHASPHAIEKMKQRAKSLGMAEGNCLACHGANIPASLNERGSWLTAEKTKRGAKACDMAWLKDYKEPTPAVAPPKKRP
jgi:mono/diheme cytochrome c family protein